MSAERTLITFTGRSDITPSLTSARFGFGAKELAGPPRAPELSQNDAIDVPRRALQMGITYFDTSPDYGLSEDFIGAAFVGGRERVTLASKCGCLPRDLSGKASHLFTADNICSGVEQSLLAAHVDDMRSHEATFGPPI